MQNVPGVQTVVALPQVAKIVTAGWNEGYPLWRVLSRNEQVLVQALARVETSTGLLNRDCSVIPVMVFTEDHKAETIERVVREVKDWRDRFAIEGTEFRLATGNVGVMAAMNEEVAASQFPILAYVFGAVILLCWASFRSLRAVACIVIPLALVSLLAYALMAFLDIGLKVNTLPVVALGVGIGVDYGIYIYSRFQFFLKEGMSIQRAYTMTLRVTGNAVVFTGITLAIGVFTWVFSPLQFQADMGILLTFMFLVNMIGAILLLPALATWLLPAKYQHERPAEYAIVRDDEAAKKPAALSHAEAASLPLVALTAWQALVETAGLKPGQTVLIHAGAGGVGSIAIQLAKLHGARVITTASKDNHDFLRSLGADRVVDYRTQRFEDAAREVDVVLDTIGGETQDRSLAMLREGGILVGLVGLTPAARAAGPGKRAIAILVRPDSEQLSRIRSLVDSGQLHPIVSHLLPLQHAAEAHRLSETRRTRGKIVLDMDAGIRAAALAYIEGWYAGDEERMAQSLHPDLVKRIVERSPGEARIDEMTAAQLIAATGSGYGRETPTDQRRTEIKVLDVFGEVASVRVDAGEWIDYMHLARFDGDWKILNVLWELR
jgi:hypothetical protein